MAKENLNQLLEKGGKLWKKFIKSFGKMNKKILLLVVLVVVILGCVLGVTALGLYKLNWDNKYMDVVIKVIPFPAAKVNSTIIKYYDWKEEVKAVKRLTEKKGENATLEAVQDDVLNKLINQAILEKLAKKFKVKVTEEDIDNEIKKIEDTLGGREELVKNIEELFGWNLYQFRNRIAYVDVLGAKVYEAVMNDESMWQEAEERAKKVLEEVKKGEKNFVTLAYEYSDDPGSAGSGGDLGWFPRGVMVKEFEDAAFALEKGQISDLVKTDYGYHIIEVVDKQEAGTDENGNEQEERVQAGHILIAVKGFNEYLNEYQDNLTIKRYVGPEYE